MTGTPVSFNASKSAGSILGYAWDYGDGATGSGPETTHVYLKEGSYRVTLHVTDDQGRVDSSSSGVFISPSTVYIDVAADPSKERYDLGDVISGVDAVVSYSGTEKVEAATVSGTLSGIKTVPLSFTENGSGKYHAALDYPIVKGETEFINITVEAKDSSGRSGRVVKKLILLPKETELMLNIHKPDKSEYAYGQKIGFEARFLRSDTLEVMEKGDLVLYEGWTDKEYAFTRQGNDYLLTYDIPRDARNPVSFIIYGNGYSGGKNYQAAKEIRFDLTHELKGEILSPTQGSYASDVREIRLRVSYPDGTTVPDDKLSAYVGNESVVLQRSGEFFEGNYTPSSNKSDLTLWIFDALGNGGQAKLKLAIRLPQRDQTAYAQQIAYGILPVIALLAAVFLAYRFVQGRRSYRKNLRKEYDETVQKIESLKAVTNNVMNEYYTRKITEEESRNRILDIEKELVVERQKLKALAQKMGSAPAETRTEKADSPAETKKPEEEVKKAVEGDGSEGQKNPE